jgi:hypothetical protein
MARKEDYAWGKERPSARTRRLRRLADRTELEIRAARAAYEKTVAGIRARQALLLQECDKIERCLDATGQYDPVLAKAASPGAWNSTEPPAKRSRGRPRIHFPGDPPPPRKSRAKAGRSVGRRSSARARSKAHLPAPATAEQIPILPAPRAPARAAAMLLPKGAYSPANDNLLPEPEAAPSRKAAPKFDTYQGQDKALAYEVEQRQRKAAQEDAFVEYERRADEMAKAAEMRQGLTFPYDLSDPCDPTKMPEELLALYPHFDKTHKLPVAGDPLELADETLYEWIKVTLFNGWSEENIKDQVYRVYRGPRQLMKDFDFQRNEITEERLRREAWHWVNVRMFHVVRLTRDFELNKIRDELAAFDYQTEAALAEGYPSDHYRESGKPKLRDAYVRIVDALQWPEHLSRREILLRARPDHNPDVLLDYSPFDDPIDRVSAWQSPDKLRHKLR